MSDFDIAPDPHAAGLTTSLQGVDASGKSIDLPVVTEKAADYIPEPTGNRYRDDLGGSSATDGCRFSM